MKTRLLSDRSLPTNPFRLRAALGWAAIGLLLPLASRAGLRDYTVRWLPSASPGVAGYELSVGTSSGDYSLTFDLGLPQAGPDSLEYMMEFEDSVDLHLALRAYDGNQLYSGFSNEIVVA